MAARYTETGTFGTSGDFNANANWASASPNSGNFILRASSQAINAGLDQSLNTYGTVQVAKDFLGDIGASGGPLRIPATDLFMLSGAAATWIDENITNIFIHSARMTDNAFQYGTSNASTAGKMVVTQGNVTLGASATVTTLSMHGIDSAIRVTAATSSTITTGEVSSGSLATSAGFTTMNQSGGRVTHAAGTGATVNLRGGRYTMNGGAISSAINLHGGILDFSQATAPIDPKVINWYGGSLIGIEKSLNLANSLLINVYGRNLRWPQGEAITLS